MSTREHQDALFLARLLSEGQRKSLSMLLRKVEVAAWNMEEQMRQETPPDLILTQMTHLPSTFQLATLIRLASVLRQEVVHLASDYGIEGEEEHCLKTLHTAFMLLRTDLENAQQQLRDDKMLELSVESLLDPRIQQMINLVHTTLDVVDGKQDARKVLETLENDTDGKKM